MVIGDINGDNIDELIITTENGFVDAIEMISGGSVYGFPIRTGGRITATPTISTLNVLLLLLFLLLYYILL